MLKGMKRSHSGFTLIEIMVGVAILGILSIIAVPSFNNMMRSTRVRTAAEAVQNGLQKARAEAISRNKNVKFHLDSNTSWQVGCVTKTATCPDPIETRDATEGSRDITTTATDVIFNNLGRPTGAASVDLSITGVHGLRVNISAGGQIKMCDPTLTTGSSPRAC